MGVAYGMWTSSLTISGNISTGSMRGEWSGPLGCTCSNDDPLHVATTACQRDPSDPTLMNFSIQNGYPGYTTSCTLRYHYTGTIPAIIQSETIHALSPSGFQLDTGPVPGDGEIWVNFTNGLGAPIDPSTGVNVSQTSVLDVQVEPNAHPSTSYKFDVEILFVQNTH
jgi:hypothetical protein